MTSFPYRLKLFSKVITKTPALKGGSFFVLIVQSSPPTRIIAICIVGLQIVGEHDDRVDDAQIVAI